MYLTLLKLLGVHLPVDPQLDWVSFHLLVVSRHSTSPQTSKFTTDPGSIQKAADFVQAFMLGFDVDVSP